MKKPLLVALFAAAVLAPLGAAHASGGVVVSVSTPEFGFRFGAPFYGPQVYAPPAFVAPVFAPPVVVVPPPRVIYRPPVVVAPRVVYRPVYVPPPRVIHGRGVNPRIDARYVQPVAYRVPPGHARRFKGYARED